MIVARVLQELEKRLDVPVVMEIPEPEPGRQPVEKFVLFSTTGGGEEEHLCSGLFIFQVYAPSPADAYTLSRTVKQAVRTLIAMPEITRLRPDGDYSFPDITRRRPRWQLVFDAIYYDNEEE